MPTKTYRDLRDAKPPPRRQHKRRAPAAPETMERKRAKLMMRGTKSVQKLLQDAGAGKEFRKRIARQRRGQKRKAVKISEPPAPKTAEPLPAEPEETTEGYDPIIA